MGGGVGLYGRPSHPFPPPLSPVRRYRLICQVFLDQIAKRTKKKKEPQPVPRHTPSWLSPHGAEPNRAAEAGARALGSDGESQSGLIVLLLLPHAVDNVQQLAHDSHQND